MVACCCLEKQKACQRCTPFGFLGNSLCTWEFIEEFTTFVKAHFSIPIIGLLLSFYYIFGLDNL
jgi:hypothetical protein